MIEEIDEMRLPGLSAIISFEPGSQPLREKSWQGRIVVDQQGSLTTGLQPHQQNTKRELLIKFIIPKLHKPQEKEKEKT